MALIRACRWVAVYAIFCSIVVRRSPLVANDLRLTTKHLGLIAPLLLAFAAVTAEVSRRRKLAQLVTNHIFGHKYFEVRLAVVHHKRVAHKHRYDSTGPPPSRDWLFIANVI